MFVRGQISPVDNANVAKGTDLRCGGCVEEGWMKSDVAVEKREGGRGGK